TTLQQMAGRYQRCMYCENSLGADIEHYRPLDSFPKLTFYWPNLLLVCSPCNRSKGKHFPRGKFGRRLLLDPTSDDPWTALVYDSKTALLTPRWLSSGIEDERGTETLKVISTLTNQAVTAGRRRAHQRLVRSVDAFLADRTIQGSPDPVSALEPAVIELRQ